MALIVWVNVFPPLRLHGVGPHGGVSQGADGGHGEGGDQSQGGTVI